MGSLILGPESARTAFGSGRRQALRMNAQAWMLACADWLEAHPAACGGILLLAYLPLALLMAHATRLSGDEIYTYRIAQQPTLSAMLKTSREIDLHPPLHFVLQRAALALHLPRWLGSRLPSLLAGGAGLWAIFRAAGRRFGTLGGLTAAAVYWFSPATDYSWSNRPYALWLGLLAVTVLLWQMSTEWDRRWWMPPLLGAASLAMVLNHMFGLVCLGPFLAAEVVLSWRRRQIDWPVALALVLPLLAGLSYCKQVLSFATNSFSPQYLPSLEMGVEICAGLVLIPAIVLGACLLISRLFPEDEPSGPLGGLRVDEWAMMYGLTLLPLVLLVLAGLHKTQFFPRYAACGAVGLGMLFPSLVEKYSPRARSVAVLMGLAMLVAACVRSSTDTFDLFGSWRASAAIGVPAQHLAALEPSLPIAVASATEFTELSDREPAQVADRLYYLTDRSAAQRFSGQTLFENEEKTVALLQLPGHAEDLKTFLRQHPRFYVVGDYMTTEEWLLRYLMASGAGLRYMGKYATTTVSDDLYLVTVPENVAAQGATAKATSESPSLE